MNPHDFNIQHHKYIQATTLSESNLSWLLGCSLYLAPEISQNNMYCTSINEFKLPKDDVALRKATAPQLVGKGSEIHMIYDDAALSA